jgi:hypothetical protein
MKKFNPPIFKEDNMQDQRITKCEAQVYTPEEAGHSYENEVGKEEEKNSRVDIAEAHITNA